MTAKTAVILDDNRLNLDVISALLEKEGIAVWAVESPRNLLSAVEEALPSVIFLDLEFPKHDGFQIFQELRSDPRLDQIPIVAYTVHTSEIDVVRRAGFDGFLGKPLDAKRFPNQLASILSGESVWEI